MKYSSRKDIRQVRKNIGVMLRELHDRSKLQKEIWERV
jgi:hypothetical protein